MNKNFIKNSDNTFLVSTDNGDQIMYETNTNTSEKNMNDILLTENTIEYLEKELWHLNCEESDLRIKNHISKGMYFIFLPVILVITSGVGVVLDGANLATVLGICGLTTSITAAFNISMTGTFLGRNKKLNKIHRDINLTEKDLENLREEIDKLKDNANLKEITTNNIKPVKEIDRTYEETYTKVLTRKLTK